MSAPLLFVAALAGVVLIAFVVNKLGGARAWYIEDWKPDTGETVLFRDDASDSYVVPLAGQAVVMSFARPRRGVVIVTDRRVLVGTRVLFGKKRMLQYALFPGPGPSPDGESAHVTGGQFTRGYQSLVVGAVEVHAEGEKPYVDLKPDRGQPSSTNIDEVRVYSDHAADLAAAFAKATRPLTSQEAPGAPARPSAGG